jgi:predicted nucleotidyltransferase
MPHAARAQQLNEELTRLVDIVSTEMQPERILVFGSMASGDIGEWSDLDVVVIMETELPFFERLHQLHDRVSPEVALDLFVYTPQEWTELTTTRPFMRDEVAAKARVVYERSGTALD